MKIETKRLELGKEKSQTLCLTLKVYEEEMPKSDETKYLGDWITTDGLNNKNINERENISENYLMDILKRQLKHSTLRQEKYQLEC